MGGGGIRAGRLGSWGLQQVTRSGTSTQTARQIQCVPAHCPHHACTRAAVADMLLPRLARPPISISAPPTCLPNTPAPTCDVGKRDAPLEGRCPEVDGLQLQRAGRSGAVRAAQGRPAAGSCSRHVAGSGQRPGSPTLGPAGWFHSIRSFWPSDGAEADMAAGRLRSWLHRVVKVHGAGQ